MNRRSDENEREVLADCEDDANRACVPTDDELANMFAGDERDARRTRSG
jgi:hypothetical protein